MFWYFLPQSSFALIAALRNELSKIETDFEKYKHEAPWTAPRA